ncbi:unnamed protein product [Paramecium primaurelia]|uniref:Uncharacterized protein n=1 Tax=Paramecium primaurelia TaxID=5886 RepID=A0A8S1NLP4_PARPR|nr:unnamed protein product [Paramecium primaurelia]
MFSGQYKCGKKQGRWDTLFKEFDVKYQNLLKNVGGGNYDMNGKKEGQWIDLHEEFWTVRRTIYQGEYFKGRKKGSFVQKKI